MNYIDMYCFLEDPEESWRAIIKENKDKYKYSLFPEMGGLIFEKPKKGIHYQNVMPGFYPFYGFTGQQ